jgi:hypothetical protein
VLDYPLEHPKDGYRRLAWQMIDADVAYMSRERFRILYITPQECCPSPSRWTPDHRRHPELARPPLAMLPNPAPPPAERPWLAAPLGPALSVVTPGRGTTRPLRHRLRRSAGGEGVDALHLPTALLAGAGPP